MRRNLSVIWVGLLVLVIGIGSYMLIKYTKEGTGLHEGYTVWALFHDASGLYEKSRVQTAGISVGQIEKRDLDPKTAMARVTIRMQEGRKLWSNAVAAKRSASLLGEFYIEIDPGTPFSKDQEGRRVENRLLHDGDEIKRVFEPTGIGDIMQEVGTTIPILRDILKDVRTLTSGPITEIAGNVNQLINRNSDVLSQLLQRVDRIAANVEGVTADGASDVKVAIHNVREITESIKALIGTSEGQVTSTGTAIRESVDKLQGAIATAEKTMQNLERISDKVNKGEGTVGQLVNDPAIANNIESITEDAGGFVRSITKLQTIVGLRTEYNFLARTVKNYVSVQLVPRPDKFYLFEIVDDPRGHRDETTTLTESSDRGTVSERTVTISEKLRFSFQFGKRVQFFGLGVTGRFGIKESTGGVGLDLSLLDDRLVLSTDVFDTRANIYPRAQARAYYALWQRNLFVTIGIDDFLNQNRARAGGGGGFDWFAGANLSFNDQDLKSLLLFGSGAIGSASGSSGK